MTVQDQFADLFILALCGMGLGVLFDTYRVFSHVWKPGRWLLHVLDLVYWMAAIVLVYRILFAANAGEVRLFVFLGLAFGVSLYYAFFSPGVLRLLQALVRVLRRCAAFLAQCFRILVWRPLIWLWRLQYVIFAFFLAVSVFLYKIVLQLLYPVRVPWKRFAAWVKRRWRRSK